MTAMDVTMYCTFLPHDDPDALLAIYRDALGLGISSNAGQAGTRCTTVGPADRSGTRMSGFPVVY